jgi:hypothetical protein
MALTLIFVDSACFHPIKIFNARFSFHQVFTILY